MAKITAPEPVEPPVEEVEAASFELDEETLELIRPASGRKAQPSIYQDDVKLAIESGKARGIRIPEDRKGTQVVAELHKAAKQLGVKVQTWNKEQTAQRLIAFRVKETPAETHHEEHRSLSDGVPRDDV